MKYLQNRSTKLVLCIRINKVGAFPHTLVLDFAPIPSRDKWVPFLIHRTSVCWICFWVCHIFVPYVFIGFHLCAIRFAVSIWNFFSRCKRKNFAFFVVVFGVVVIGRSNVCVESTQASNFEILWLVFGAYFGLDFHTCASICVMLWMPLTHFHCNNNINRKTVKKKTWERVKKGSDFGVKKKDLP